MRLRLITDSPASTFSAQLQNLNLILAPINMAAAQQLIQQLPGYLSNFRVGLTSSLLLPSK